MLAFSCTDRESFKSVGKWKKKVEEECGNIPMVLVMTKMDLLYQATMDRYVLILLILSLFSNIVFIALKLKNCQDN